MIHDIAATSTALAAEISRLEQLLQTLKHAQAHLEGLPASAPVQSTPDVQKLSMEIDAWQPQLTRQPLEQLYYAVCLTRPAHLPALPEVLDMADAECRRNIENYLRHQKVPGYRDFCVKLKSFTGLGSLYKRVRDKATACIINTYPELAGYTVTAGDVSTPVAAQVFSQDTMMRLDEYAVPQLFEDSLGVAGT